MEITSLISRIVYFFTILTLAVVSGSAYANTGRAGQLDSWCGGKPAGAVIPQESHPYTANGCTECHTSIPNLNAVGTASTTCSGSGASTTCGATLNQYCIKTHLTGASIISPTTGTSVSPGGTVTFTAGTPTDPDGFASSTFTYKWSFSNGTNLTGQSVNLAVPSNASGTLTGTLTVTDVDGLPATTSPTRSVTVSAPASPVANADSYSVITGQTLSVAAPGVLSNDTNPLGTGTLSATRVNNVTHGTLTFNANGSFTYTPSTGYTGADSFSYTASNGTLTSTAATVSIIVTSATAQPPVANADSYSVQAGKTLTVAAPGVLSNDTNPSGKGTLTAKLVTGPKNYSSFALNANGGFTYTPKSGFTGTDGFTYTDSNGTLTSSPAMVTITVTPPAGPCTDKDKDGYSPEGGACGPKDCDDTKAGTWCKSTSNACIDKILANQVKIDSAAWDGEHTLTVTGSNVAKGAVVSVYDAVSNTLLGKPQVQDSGQWKLEKEGLATAPCRVKAVIGTVSGERAVSGAPASCGTSSSAQATCSVGDDSEHDSNVLSSEKSVSHDQ